jgi:hypothetical protein
MSTWIKKKTRWKKQNLCIGNDQYPRNNSCCSTIWFGTLRSSYLYVALGRRETLPVDMGHENIEPSKQEQLKHHELHLALDFRNLSSQRLFSWRQGNLVQATAVPEENIYKNLGTSNNNWGVLYGYYFTTRRSYDVTNILPLSSPPFYMGVKPGLSQERNTIPWGCSIIGSSRRYLGQRTGGEVTGDWTELLNLWQVCEARPHSALHLS